MELPSGPTFSFVHYMQRLELWCSRLALSISPLDAVRRELAAGLIDYRRFILPLRRADYAAGSRGKAMSAWNSLRNALRRIAKRYPI
jgi:hypothetical protein